MATGSLVNPKRPTLRELCEIASVERDSERLVAMAEEICHRLMAGERVTHQQERLGEKQEERSRTSTEKIQSLP